MNWCYSWGGLCIDQLVSGTSALAVEKALCWDKNIMMLEIKENSWINTVHVSGSTVYFGDHPWPD
jgi:hypothetical protein